MTCQIRPTSFLVRDPCASFHLRAIIGPMRTAEHGEAADAPAPLSERIAGRRWENGQLREATTFVVREARVRMHVNGAEWLSMMATPHDLDLLALGFLATEGVISGREDVRRIVVCPSGSCVEVWLRDAAVTRPEHSTLTSGCGGGITFADLSAQEEPLATGATVFAPPVGPAYVPAAGTRADARAPYCCHRRRGGAAGRGGRRRAGTIRWTSCSGAA